MKKVIALSALILVAMASLATAAGINMSINDCGSNGITNAVQSCASNTGIAIAMVGSAIAPAGMDRVVACEGYIDVQTNQATLSAWWTLDGCRAAALTGGFDFTAGPFNCNDFWAGLASGGVVMGPLHTQPNRSQIKLVCATVAENPMDDATENYLFKVNILRSKSTGTGSCAGCTDQACLVLNRLVINQPAGALNGDATITNPMFQNYVTYGGGAVGGGPNGGTGCPGATPSQNRTWGQVKSLYR